MVTVKKGWWSQEHALQADNYTSSYPHVPSDSTTFPCLDRYNQMNSMYGISPFFLIFFHYIRVRKLYPFGV